MAEAIRKFITDDETGAIKLQFLDADTGLDIPLTQLLDYNILAENGLGELSPVNAGITTSANGADLSGFKKPEQPLIPVSPGSGSERSHYGSTDPRTQSNNFGYVNKPGILGAAKLSGPIGQVAGALGATGLMGPIGAIGLAGQVANGVINSNNALAVDAARKSMGLPGLSGPQIAKGTVMGVGNGQVADVTANGQTYSVGLEGLTEDGRTPLTPEEARRRSLGKVVEATPEEAQANIESFGKEPGLNKKGMLGRIADSVLGRDTAAPVTSAPAVTTPTVSTAPLGVTSAVSRSNLPDAAKTAQAAPESPVASQMGINTTGKGLLGAPSTPNIGMSGTASLSNGFEASGSTTASAAGGITPRGTASLNNGLSVARGGSLSFADNMSPTEVDEEAGSIPSVPASKLGSVSNIGAKTSKTPGLAGISPSFEAGMKGTIGSFNRKGLTSGVLSAVDAVGKALGPDVGINSGFRSAATNAKANGAKQSQHLQGNAVDIDTTGWSDAQKSTALEAAATAGAKGIGIYSSGNSLHIDARQNFGTWGPSPRGAYKGVPIGAQPSWAQDTLTAIQDSGPFKVGPKVGPTPTARPNQEVAPGVVSNVGLAGMVNQNVDSFSVGRLQNEGFAPNYTDQEVAAMAVGLAGELGPNTLRGVARQDPQAMAELGSIVSTMSNRMAQEGVEGIRDPAQFNAFSKTPNKKTGVAPATTTKQNFEKFGDSLIDGVRGVATGNVQSPTPDSTHYANYSVAGVDTSWKNDMTKVSQVGQHTFGTIPGEFGAKKSAAAKQQADRAKQAVANFSDYSGVARAEQKQDRAVTKTSTAGVAAKSAPAKAEATKTEATKAESTKSSPSKSDSNKSSGGEKSGSKNNTSGPSKSSTGASSGGNGVGSKSSSSKSSSSSSKSDSDSSKGGKSGGGKGKSK